MFPKRTETEDGFYRGIRVNPRPRRAGNSVKKAIRGIIVIYTKYVNVN